MDLKKHAGLHFLFDTTQVQLEHIAAPRPRRDGGAAPEDGAVKLMHVNVQGWAFGNEENLLEFAEDMLKKNPAMKLVKYSLRELFETQPSPMQRKAWEPEDGVFK